MENRNSNITSIIVAIISIGLIIFSVWLLNATFNNRSRESTIASTSSSSTSISSSSSISSSLISSSSRSVVIDPSESESSSFSTSTSSTSSSSNSSSSQSNSSSTSSSNTSSSSASSQFSLSSGEFVATLIEPTARGSNFEIVECNVPTPVFCQPGFRFPFGEFDSSENLVLFNGEIGARYRFSGTVTDSEEGLSVSGATPQKIN